MLCNVMLPRFHNSVLSRYLLFGHVQVSSKHETTELHLLSDTIQEAMQDNEINGAGCNYLHNIAKIARVQ